jgi:sugar-specific transcriptional regulator TrmB
MEILTEREKQVFFALHKLNSATAQQIAKETLLNRTALYHTLDLLTKKGLVTPLKKDFTTVFQPISLQDFELWSKKQVTDMKSELDNMKESISASSKPESNLYSQIRYYEGFEPIQRMYYNTLRDNKRKEILAITDYSKAYETMNDFFEKEYFPDRVKKGITVKSLLSASKLGKRDLARRKELLREMKVNDVFKDFGIEINVFNNDVMIVSFDEKKPTGIMIKNPIISEAFRRIFGFLWDKS